MPCSNNAMVQRTERAVQQSKGFTLLELTIVLVLIALIAATGVKYYQDLLKEARGASMEILAHRFTTATALVRAQWILQGGPSRRVPGMMVDVDGIAVYVNEHGWPANTDGGSARSHDQTDAECAQLWRALLQNPPLITTGETAPAANDMRYRFHIKQIGGRVCRYQMVTPDDEFFFDYHLTTGQILTEVPPFQPASRGGEKARIN